MHGREYILDFLPLYKIYIGVHRVKYFEQIPIFK